MKVLLKKDIQGVGRKNEIKNVSDGYFRNFLMPNGFAVSITEEVRAELEQQTVKKDREMKKRAATVGILQEKLSAKQIVILSKMDETGKLFGSVNAMAIEKELKKSGFDLKELRGKIILSEPLKTKGAHGVPLQFSDGSTALATVIIDKQ